MGNKKSILFLGVAVLGLFLVNAVFGPINITQAANTPVTGYAWSDNIGWIQMNPAFGGVQVDDSTGNFSGYAWSDNIGWVNFAPSSGYPEAPNEGAKLNFSTGQITGWIKAIAADNNGWDGWIKMRGGAGSVITCPSGYVYNQITLKCEASPTYSCASGYTYNSSTGKCEQSPTCPTGGSYSETNNRCEVGATLQPISLSGLYSNDLPATAVSGAGSSITFSNYLRGSGTISATGITFSGSMTSYRGPVVASYIIKMVGSGNKIDFYDAAGTTGSVYIAGANVSGSYNSGGGITRISGSGDTLQVNNGPLITFSSTTYTCPSGYTLDGSICTASATCSSGGTLNNTTDKCELAPITSCPSGGSFNSLTGKCEADPTLEGGTGSSYGVDANLATGAFSGYAWGSDVVGWVSFSGSGYGVTMNPLAPTVNISSSPPNPIDYNTSATLTWTSANVTSCDASGDWSGGKATSGSESTGNLTSAKTYTITCAGPGGIASNSVTVNVGGALSCALPWGGTISHGSNVTAYSTDQVACGVSCSSVSETRTCNNGVLSGSYTNLSCSPAVCPDFSLSSSNAIFASLIGDAPSESTETTIKIVNPTNFSGDVSLSISQILDPNGNDVTSHFPNYTFGDSTLSQSEYSTDKGSTFKISVPAGTSKGVYSIIIQGNGTGGIIRTNSTRPVQLNIEAIEPSWIEI